MSAPGERGRFDRISAADDWSYSPDAAGVTHADADAAARLAAKQGNSESLQDTPMLLPPMMLLTGDGDGRVGAANSVGPVGQTGEGNIRTGR